MQVCHYSNVLSLALDRPSASGGAGLAELLGDTLLTKEGEVPLKMALGGKKHVMLYFSAHWCPPCKQYTPELARAYAASTKHADVAIVF